MKTESVQILTIQQLGRSDTKFTLLSLPHHPSRPMLVLNRIQIDAAVLSQKTEVWAEFKFSLPVTYVTPLAAQPGQFHPCVRDGDIDRSLLMMIWWKEILKCFGEILKRIEVNIEIFGGKYENILWEICNTPGCPAWSVAPLCKRW